MTKPFLSLLARLAGSLVFTAGAFAGPIIVDGNIQLPNPAGSTVIALWSGSNASIVSAPTSEDPEATQLEWSGNWVNSAATTTAEEKKMININANYSLGGSFALNSSNSLVNATSPTSVYTMNATNTVFTGSTDNYTGAVFGKVILQLTPNASNDRDLQLDPTFTIGGVSYTAAQAGFSYERGFDGVDGTGGIYSNPDSQYNGYYGTLSLVTYEWDLIALGYAGSYEEFAFTFNLPQTHTSLYEVQLSVVPVPEPSAYALSLAALVGLLAFLRRRQYAGRA
ncbi:PEP-CTERM sorting domain-containing protein [Ruficoccus amylovorans]|uniref:PEP-CTERM sorting domain-containing protein n=1 Tax=Ruficoccus amylovorans TaxID=1804625 RepID=A0A842HI75_9BACT|nr:PEP-CTERM sorting domain-containing protein [Ruficoccus amylovorans]MBC2595264.1 PEP-CTERM sorting domain-containing protein [Ruficoccus amylovorans]